MAGKPLVAIVGRTNVGKSSIFNRLVGKRLAVVDDLAGVTRDRVYAEADLAGRRVILVDTGGLASGHEDELFTKVREQAIVALREADAIVLVVDAQEGPVSLDHDVADVVRRVGKPIVFVANKAESGTADITVFGELGLGQPIAASAIHGRGIGALVEDLLDLLPPEDDQAGDDARDAVAIAVVGRPNAGKSSVVNYLAGEERSIVAETPGTTRDALDVLIQRGDRKFLLVDTAGMPRRFKQAGGLEYYTALRSLRAIDRADVAVLLMDAAEGPSTQDSRLAGEAQQMGRGLVLCAHKWDLVRDRALEGEQVAGAELARRERLLHGDYDRMVRDRLPFVPHAPLLFTSVVSALGMDRLLPLAAQVGEAASRRVETGRVNRVIQQAVAKHAPPSRGGRPVRILYATQVGVRPPTLVLFVNDPRLVPGSYKRYLENFLREELFGPGVPLRLHFRARRRKDRD